MERKEREKQMRRDAIIHAAEAVFFEKGLRAATLDDVANRAEVSKGTIYLYFSSKEELYCALMTRGLILLLDAFRASRPEEVGPAEAIQRLGEVYLTFSTEQSYLFKMLSAIESSVVTESVSTDVFSALEEASDNILSYVATFIQKGIDDGVFRKDVSAHEAVILFWASLSGILNLKERSSAMKIGDVLNADSIIGSVDFETLYSKCQSYLLSFLGAGEITPGNRRSAAAKPRGAAKKSKATRRK